MVMTMTQIAVPHVPNQRTPGTEAQPHAAESGTAERKVDEAGTGSFPASDAPSWWGGAHDPQLTGRRSGTARSAD